MKLKMLFLIPLTLLLLCATPLALHKDTVGFSGKMPAFESLAPSSWKLIEFSTSVSGSVSTTSTSADASNGKAVNPPLTSGASYKGFPFGAYFENKQSLTTGNSSSNSYISGWSWLWAFVDVLLIIITLLVAIALNRRMSRAQPQQPFAPAPVSTNSVVNPTGPNTTPTPQFGNVIQPTIVTPLANDPNTALTQPVVTWPSQVPPAVNTQPVDPQNQAKSGSSE